MNDQLPEGAMEHLLRELAPQVLGAVARRFRDFSTAEDAVQEALLAAFRQWPRDGIPENPCGWLIQVASRRMADIARSEIARRQRETAHAVEEPVIEPAEIEAEMDPEDTLILLFMCCHSALSASSAIALTLRAVGGLTTAEIANAFLVPEATMAQRISRAKQSVKTSDVAFQMPEASERAERLGSVLHVLYLIFNEGYTSTSGTDLQRTDLSSEAIRLTRLLVKLAPDDGEALGLLALMLLTDARRLARSGPNGELIPLDEQDRGLWNKEMIAEGMLLVSKAFSLGNVGEYQLQAAISALHDEAPRVDDTDWPQIQALYGVLMRMADNPMTVMNHAIAAAMVHGPAKGLELLAPLEKDERLRGNHRLDAVRAHLLERAGDKDKAVKLYQAAAAKTNSIPEKNYLMLKAARLRDGC